jgi:hypothetical protein
LKKLKKKIEKNCLNPNGVRQENLFRVGNLAGVEAVLGDLSSLNLVALLQLALTKT